MNRDQILSVILALTFFGVLISWSPVTAEEVTGQEQDVSLYLYSQNGVGKLHTKETGGHGDSETVQIQPGSSVFFALNNSLQADLPVKSYRSNIGFHIYLYASSTDWNAGHLKIFVRDGTTMTNGEIIASGEINIPAAFADEVHVDIPWEDDYGPEYIFDTEHFIVLELENDGSNGVNLDLDSGKSGDSPSRLITTTNPVRDIEVISESYNLETSDSEDKIITTNFNPNLPSEISKMFVSGEALNAFGTYDITRFQVSVFDSDDNELFVGEVEVEEPEQNSGTNTFEDIVWNYNDPSEPTENHNGKGLYTVEVAAIDQQGNEFSLEKQVQMDAYGVYLSTPEPEQSVAVGGEVWKSTLTLIKSGINLVLVILVVAAGADVYKMYDDHVNINLEDHVTDANFSLTTDKESIVGDIGFDIPKMGYFDKSIDVLIHLKILESDPITEDDFTFEYNLGSGEKIYDEFVLTNLDPVTKEKIDNGDPLDIEYTITITVIYLGVELSSTTSEIGTKVTTIQTA